MKINAVQIRPGNVLEHKAKLWVVSKIMHTQPGKGGAYMQVEMKDIKSGTKLNERFRSDETVERARLDQKDYQYLYDEGETLALMDQQTFEQISVDKSLFGDAIVFLQDGMKIIVELHEDKPVSATLPDYVTLEIVESEPVVKGQTASSSYKPAKLENGVRIMVPPFIEAGTKVVVNTATQEYFERAKA